MFPDALATTRAFDASSAQNEQARPILTGIAYYDDPGSALRSSGTISV
jgi:hypothetical protein